eukprot:GAHX01001747.1.p1 GENE.GAHX01001747.1~~GAHX01001747.1.p1  ORF type:complete len:112 (-),score=12.64 GAHX01001747.1:266-577(-)
MEKFRKTSKKLYYRLIQRKTDAQTGVIYDAMRSYYIYGFIMPFFWILILEFESQDLAKCTDFEINEIHECQKKVKKYLFIYLAIISVFGVLKFAFPTKFFKYI